jgi:hypothetical protein
MRPAFRREWDGEGKAESLPWRGPAGKARHTGATISASGTKGRSPWQFPLEPGRRRSASLSRNAAQERHPCSGATPPGALRAGLWASGRPASREARVPAGQSENAAPSRSEAGKSATLKTPAQPTPLLIFTGIGQDYWLGSRQRIERLARRAAAMILRSCKSFFAPALRRYFASCRFIHLRRS